MWCGGSHEGGPHQHEEHCLAPLTKYELDLGERMCGSTNQSSPPTTSATNMCVGRLLGSLTTIHVHAIHISKYDNTITFWLCHSWTKLYTALVAGVHLH